MCQCNLIEAQISRNDISLACRCGNPHLSPEETQALKAVAEYLCRS